MKAKPSISQKKREKTKTKMNQGEMHISEQKAENIQNIENQNIFQSIKENPLESFWAVLWPILGFLSVFALNKTLEDPISYYIPLIALLGYFIAFSIFSKKIKKFYQNFLVYFSLFFLAFVLQLTNSNYIKTSVLESAEEGKINFAFLRMVYEGSQEIQEEASEQWSSVLDYFDNKFVLERTRSRAEVPELKILKEFSFSKTKDIESEIKKDYLENFISEEGGNLDVVFFGNSNPNPTQKQDIDFAINFLVTDAKATEIELPENLKMNVMIGNISAKATLSDKEDLSDLFLALAFFVGEDYQSAEKYFSKILTEKALGEETKEDLNIYLVATKVMQNDFEGAKKLIANSGISFLLPENRLIAALPGNHIGKKFNKPKPKQNFKLKRFKKRHNKDLARIYNLLGVVEMGLGNFEEAEKQFKESKDIDKKFIASDNNFAVSNIAIGAKKIKQNPKEAKERFQVARQVLKVMKTKVDSKKMKAASVIEKRQKEIEKSQTSVSQGSEQLAPPKPDKPKKKKNRALSAIGMKEEVQGDMQENIIIAQILVADRVEEEEDLIEEFEDMEEEFEVGEKEKIKKDIEENMEEIGVIRQEIFSDEKENKLMEATNDILQEKEIEEEELKEFKEKIKKDRRLRDGFREEGEDFIDEERFRELEAGEFEHSDKDSKETEREEFDREHREEELKPKKRREPSENVKNIVEDFYGEDFETIDKERQKLEAEAEEFERQERERAEAEEAERIRHEEEERKRHKEEQVNQEQETERKRQEEEERIRQEEEERIRREEEIKRQKEENRILEEQNKKENVHVDEDSEEERSREEGRMVDENNLNRREELEEQNTKKQQELERQRGERVEAEEVERIKREQAEKERLRQEKEELMRQEEERRIKNEEEERIRQEEEERIRREEEMKKQAEENRILEENQTENTDEGGQQINTEKEKMHINDERQEMEDGMHGAAEEEYLKEEEKKEGYFEKDGFEEHHKEREEYEEHREEEYKEEERFDDKYREEHKENFEDKGGFEDRNFEDYKIKEEFLDEKTR